MKGPSNLQFTSVKNWYRTLPIKIGYPEMPFQYNHVSFGKSIIKSVSHRPMIWKDEREFKRLTQEHTQKNTDSPLVYENHAHRVKRRRLSEVKFSPDIQDRHWQKFGTPVQAPTRISDIKIKTYSIPSPVTSHFNFV